MKTQFAVSPGGEMNVRPSVPEGGQEADHPARSARVLALIFSLVAMKNEWHWPAELHTQRIYGCLKGEHLA